MPLEPPAPSTSPAGPNASTRQSPRPPDHPCETVWRHTFLAQFTNPAGREALQRFGGLLYTAALSAGYVGNRDRLVAADDLDAVAADIDILDAALWEISEVPTTWCSGESGRACAGRPGTGRGAWVTSPTRSGVG